MRFGNIGARKTLFIEEIQVVRIPEECYAFLGKDASGLIDHDNGKIYVDPDYLPPCHEYPLVATFSITGVQVRHNLQKVVSGVTKLTFLPWITLTVRAEDGSTRDYEVRVRQRLSAFVGNVNPNENKVSMNHVGGGLTIDSGQSLGYSDSYDVGLGDLDGDGDLDAFIADMSSGGNMVWLNDGAARFTDSGLRLGSSFSRAVALGDLGF